MPSYTPGMSVPWEWALVRCPGWTVRGSRSGKREAGLDLKGSAVCSDAFFPFADGLLAAADAGATAAIQPGGSVRDDEVVAAANERGMAMVLTGARHFKH